MTIRNLLKRRSDRYARYASLFLLLVGASTSLLPRSFAVRFAFAAVIAVIVVAAFWSLFEIPCPVCRKALGILGLRVALGGLRKSVPRCPHCSTGIDDELPERAVTERFKPS
jgi:hypothetical protein